MSRHLEKRENEYDETYQDLVSAIKNLNKLIPTTSPDQEDAGFGKAAERNRAQSFQNWKGKANANNERLAVELSRSESRVSELQNEVDRLQNQLQQRDGANRRLGMVDQEKWTIDLMRAENKEETSTKDGVIRRVCELQREVDLCKRQLREETSAKDDAIRRLSKLGPNKLRDSNPNIADLSDKYRPTKIAEVVSELYDNEWTDAFDELEKLEQYNNNESVHRLLDIFVHIYSECRHVTTTGYFERIQACIEQSDVLNIQPKDSAGELPDQLRQHVKEVRKFRSEHILVDVVMGVLKRESLNYLRQHPYNTGAMWTYVKKCAEISWMMCVQDPALVLSTETNKEFNTSLFRAYTKRGPYVEFVVWPIVYLHEGGPILCKGVAQGTKDETTTSARGDHHGTKSYMAERLSELASSKVFDNNIADLSDKYKPTRIAEVVSELYDNEWADAFDELEELEQYNKNEIVHRLLDIFVLNIQPKDSDSKLPDQLRQQVKEFRKFRAQHILDEVVMGILKRESLNYLRQHPYNTGAMLTYVKKCTEISWLMCVQDPALVLSTKTNKEFNTSLFREYTKRGPYVEFVVWPIVYLHEGGPILCKGVAQGTKDVTTTRPTRVRGDYPGTRTYMAKTVTGHGHKPGRNYEQELMHQSTRQGHTTTPTMGYPDNRIQRGHNYTVGAGGGDYWGYQQARGDTRSHFRPGNTRPVNHALRGYTDF